MRTTTALTLLLSAVMMTAGCDRELVAPDETNVQPGEATIALNGGNAVNVEKCNNFQDWNTREGQPFTSFAECVSYGARGSQIISDDALVCLDGGWQNLGDGTTPFATEQECVDYADTGTPAPFADVSIATDPTTIGCGLPSDPAYCTSIHIRVFNSGATNVTVSWSLNGTFIATSALGAEIITPPEYGTNGTCTHVLDNTAGTFVASCTGVSVPPGGSTFIAHVIARVGSTQTGTVNITASSLPDPNLANNTFSYNFTAPSPP
jgi:hypothetical protein